jgi:hypothetical protein
MAVARCRQSAAASLPLFTVLGCRTWHPCPRSVLSAATLRLFGAGAEALPSFVRFQIPYSLTIDPNSANDTDVYKAGALKVGYGILKYCRCRLAHHTATRSAMP